MEGKSVSFVGVLWRTVLSIGLAYLLVRVFLGILKKRLQKLGQVSPPEVEGFSKLWGGLSDNLPRLAALLLFGIVSTVIFLLLAGEEARRRWPC